MSYGKKLYKSNLTAFDAENVYDSTIGKLQNEINADQIVSLNDKVSKSGDTMTGNLYISRSSPGIGLRSTMTDGTAPSSATNQYGFRIRDKDDANVALFTDRWYSDGRQGAWIAGYRNGVANSLYLLINDNGDPIVDLSRPAAWRTALSLNAINNIGAVGTGGLRIDFLNGTDQYYMPFYAGASENNKITLFDKNWNVVWKIPRDYKANDTFSINSSIVATGFINGNSTTFWLDYSVDKSMENISTVSVTAMKGYTMGVSGGLDGTTSEKNYTESPYTISVTKQGNNHVRIGVTKSSAFTNTTPLTPVTYFGTLTLKFT